MMQHLTNDNFTTPSLVLPRAARGRKEVGGSYSVLVLTQLDRHSQFR